MVIWQATLLRDHLIDAMWIIKISSLKCLFLGLEMFFWFFFSLHFFPIWTIALGHYRATLETH